MADHKVKGKAKELHKKPNKDPKTQEPLKGTTQSDPEVPTQKSEGSKETTKGLPKVQKPEAPKEAITKDSKSTLRSSASPGTAKPQDLEPSKQQTKAVDPQAQKGRAMERKPSKMDPKNMAAKPDKEAPQSHTIQRSISSPPTDSQLMEQLAPDGELEEEVFMMLDAQGNAMVDSEGHAFPGRYMMDSEGNFAVDSEGNLIPGRFQLNEEGSIIVDDAGTPILERQETVEEKQFREAREEALSKAAEFRQKLQAQREMMRTPLPKKPIPWKKYCNSMYLPRHLRTAILKDRGTPGDDWKKYAKIYTVKEMNHRLAYHLHGRSGVIWRKLHEHVSYLQNPRYATQQKHIKALRIFRLTDTPEGKKYMLLDPTVAYFDGFEPNKTYVQHMRILNVSPWSQRIRVLKPVTHEYSINSDEEPFQGRTLVSGHKCDFDIIFQPPTVYLYKDFVTVKTEMDTVHIRLEAINPYPVVVFPTFVDMGICLAGHAICYHYTLTSRGAGAKFFFTPYKNVNDRDDHSPTRDCRYDDLEEEYYQNNVLLVPPFILYPQEFTTTAEQKQEFIVLFRPPAPGTYYIYLQLRTHTHLHWEVKIKATGVALKLNLQKLEGQDFRPGQIELGVDFGHVTVSHTISKEVTVKSHIPLPIRFYWRIQSKHLAPDQEVDPECILKERVSTIENFPIFEPDPASGVFAEEAETPVRFKFTPSDLENYHQVACLYVDTRSPLPLSSDVWREFRENLRSVEYKKANELANMEWEKRILWGIDRSGFERSGKKLEQSKLQQVTACIDGIFHVSQVENGGTIFRMLELDLDGSGTYFDTQIIPSLLQFSGILTVGQNRIQNIEIVNNSPTEVIFTWQRPKTLYGVVENSACTFPMTGKVGATSSKKIEVTMKAKKVGRIELVLPCLVESPCHKGKLPLALKVEGHVTGPHVIMSPPVLDFGLCQRDSTYTLEITLTNKSRDAPATFKIFSARDSQIPPSSPTQEDSQINPLSPNSKVPVGCTTFNRASETHHLSSSLGLQGPELPMSSISDPALPHSPTSQQDSPATPGEMQSPVPCNSHQENRNILPCPFRKVPQTVTSTRPNDRPVSSEFITEPQPRAWISPAFGECFQVFNDGITDPKLPPTTLLLPRDPLSPKSTLPPLKAGPLPPLASGIMKGLSTLVDKKVISSVGDATRTRTNVPTSTAPDSQSPHNAGTLKEVGVPKLHEKLGSAPPAFVDTSIGTSVEINSGQNDTPVVVRKPFLEQMGDLGSSPKDYGSQGPPILKTGGRYASYEEDLLQTLVFEPAEGIIPKGNQSVTLKVTLTGTICGFMRLAIICQISGGLSPTLYAIARANIDAPEACLIPCFVDLRTKFINIPIDLSVVIRNLKPLPACFNWPPRDRIGEVEDLDVEVRPQRGEIPPRLEWGLKFNLIPRKYGPLDTVLICNVYKMINPLGLQIKAVIVDVRISYYVFRPDREDGHQKSGRKVAFERILLKRKQDALGNPVEEEDPENWVDPPVPCLDFGRRKELGKAHCLKLLVRNHSPIETTIRLTIGKFHTEPLASLVRDELWVISSLTERLSHLIPTRRDPFQSAMKHKKRQHPALTDLSDTHLKYFSQTGKQMLWRRAEGAMHEALIREGQPIAFFCYPSYTGILKPWSDWSCEVVCLSNFPGNYIDILTSKVGRLEQVDIPLEVQIIGTPLVARRNWVEPTGLQQPPNEGEITIMWQPTPAGMRNLKLPKQFWVRNQSPFHIELKWELKRQATVEGKFVTMQFVIEEDLLAHGILTEKQSPYAEDPHVHVTTKEHIGIVYEQQVHVIFRDYLESMPSTAPSSFHIQPATQVILGQSSFPFEIFLHEDMAGTYSHVYVGYTRIYDGHSCERRRSTQFVFDKIDDRPDEQYVYRRPEKKHICEHVITFHSKKDDKFLHTLAHKTSIVDPADPEVLALNFNEDGTRPRSLSRFHCDEASDSGYEDRHFKRGNSTTSKRVSQTPSKPGGPDFLDAADGGESSSAVLELRVADSPQGVKAERAYSKVHDVAYESEDDEEEPKYQFDIRRRSTRRRRVSRGREVNFDMSQAEDEDVSDDNEETKPTTSFSESDICLDLFETTATHARKEFYTFDALRSLRVSVEAVIVVPRLKTNLDDSLSERLSFLCYGNDPPETRFDTQALYITNPYTHPMVFDLFVPEPFEVMNIRTGVVKPVESGTSVQRMSLFQGASNRHELESGMTLQFNLNYRPVVDECQLNPEDVIIDADIRIEFSDVYHQLVPLHAELLFPELSLVTDALWLGEVVTATSVQAMDFSLSNPCLPDADWRIVTEKMHLETVDLAAMGIPPQWEESKGLDKIWPVIWFANPERGTVRGRRDFELGFSNAMQYHWNKQIVTISFAPFYPIEYNQTIWIEVRMGRGVRLVLDGRGIDERPPTPPPPSLPADEPKGYKKKEVKKGKGK